MENQEPVAEHAEKDETKSEIKTQPTITSQKSEVQFEDKVEKEAGKPEAVKRQPKVSTQQSTVGQVPPNPQNAQPVTVTNTKEKKMQRKKSISANKVASIDESENKSEKREKFANSKISSGASSFESQSSIFSGRLNEHFSSNSPTSTVEISISCRNLINKDTFSKSDPMCVVFQKPSPFSKKWVELLRTEMIDDDLNPDFCEKARLAYYFEERQMLKFELYDVDKMDLDLTKHDFLGTQNKYCFSSFYGHTVYVGYCECTLAQIVAAGNSGLQIPLLYKFEKHIQYKPEEVAEEVARKKLKNAGEIILIAEELSSLKDELTADIYLDSSIIPISYFWLRLKTLFNKIFRKKSDVVKNSDPKIFMIISKLSDSSIQYITVHKSVTTSIFKGENKKIDFPQETISLQRLCNGDQNLKLKFEFFYKQSSLGYAITNVGQITGNNKQIKGPTGDTVQTFPSKTVICSGRNGKPINGGKVFLNFENALVEPRHTFIDYIQAGCDIHCCFSIDFTSSNGHPGKLTSLHHISTEAGALGVYGNNPYEQAILGVGQIMEDYDTDKLFPVYGFGAKIPPDRSISHLFNISTLISNNNAKNKKKKKNAAASSDGALARAHNDVYCNGIKGVLDTYRDCLKKIELFGPTNFCPVIEQVTELALSHTHGDHYFVLIIITDGVITDTELTKEAIVLASELPISIIIIGVGDEDFSEMEELDGDLVRLSFRGREARRDIVQFIPYRNAKHWVAHCVGEDYLDKVINKLSPLERCSTIFAANPSELAADRHAKQKMNQIGQQKLAQEVLGEIPGQFMSYMKSKGVKPVYPEKPELHDREKSLAED